ncbi:hypothetical protein [Pinisolibacter aquiterrae]|uniref:hypothetical protein n=1 Tax=Pinisolibacter aquiterrae TaxID=2815579 RepID=UPI001C3D5599|nr:hypothetical protein [Pinisolibacter aquiterrae]MBV5264707.1 hypothetical protein [Pinisolibacter aquiterrae]MCC8233476.1 hypothetical protein [Pinisolibacter aquiterrae]
MLYWAGAGLLAGWVMSRGLRGSRFGALAVIVGVVALVLVAAARRFETDALVACLVFWVAAQVAWFLGNLLTDGLRTDRDAEEAKTPLG